MKIVLDTNFIIACLKKKIDIEREISKAIEGDFELVLLTSVLDEIKKFSENMNKKILERTLAAVFLKMLEEKKINLSIFESKQKNPDEAIKLFCKKNKNSVVATFDGELRRKIRSDFLSIRGKRIILVEKSLNFKKNKSL